MNVRTFRSRFLDWGEPRGLEVPTTARSLRAWVGEYLEDHPDDEEEAEEYLNSEIQPMEDTP